MAVLADHTFFEIYGNQTTGRLQQLIQKANQLTSDQLGIQLKLVDSVIIGTPTSSERFWQLESVQAPDRVIDRIQQALNTAPPMALQGKRHCLVHVVSAIAPINDTLGSGQNPGLCRSNGMNSAFSLLTRKETDPTAWDEALHEATFAHEIVHGLGALHDLKNGRCDPGRGKRYLMAPSIPIESVNLWQVSDCSKEDVAVHVNALDQAGVLCFNGNYANDTAALDVHVDYPGVSQQRVSSTGVRLRDDFMYGGSIYLLGWMLLAVYMFST